jgi:adenylate isopentenyltransferase (cytokinin synthase)
MPPPIISLPDRADTMRPPPPSLVLRHAAPKHKAVVVMGATGTGKSRLAIDLALRFGGEVINSDKMQLYDGLDVATNKVTPGECAGVPHHLLGVVSCPDDDFSAADFRREAARAAAGAAARGRIPVVAGGSNSYVEELVEGDRRAFRERYDCCFLWVDVQLPVLRDFVARRVDDMCRRGLVDEVAAAFDPRRTDYSRGLWRAIGAPELDAYLRSTGAGEDERELMLAAAIDEIATPTMMKRKPPNPTPRENAKISRAVARPPTRAPIVRDSTDVPATTSDTSIPTKAPFDRPSTSGLASGLCVTV